MDSFGRYVVITERKEESGNRYEKETNYLTEGITDKRRDLSAGSCAYVRCYGNEICVWACPADFYARFSSLQPASFLVSGIPGRISPPSIRSVMPVM